MDRPIDDSATRATLNQPVAELIDSVCDSFELAWRSGDFPDIGRYLQDQRVADDTRVSESALLVELVLIDVEFRRRRGEAAPQKDYLSKFPGLHEAVGTAFARMETMLVDVSPERPLHPMLGRFELLEQLGEGAFGVVWKAQDPRMRRLVAIKQLRGSLSDQNWRILEREAQAAARLNHPNVARIFEVSEAVTSPYIVFEYIEGRSLKARIEESPDRRIEPREAASLVAQIAAGLHHVHERGLVHRDLKPANIILSREGIPKIVDFGLARHVDAKSSLSHEGALIGTLPYMSPQQCLGQPVDAQTDIYSLSVVLYELLSGRCPFEGSLGELVGRIPKGDPPAFPPDLAALRPLEEICRRGMETEPAERYATARELLEDLERYLAGETPRLRPPQAWWRRAVTCAKRGRREFLVGAAAVGAGTVVAGDALFSIVYRRFVADDGQVPVTLTTEPPGAEVSFIPLDPRNGSPQPEAMKTSPVRSPVATRLQPGDYLVVAKMNDGSGHFHEVFRHVPRDPKISKGAYAFRQWEIDPSSGGVVLPKIVIPLTDITQGMALIPPAANLSIRREDGSAGPSFVCAVPSFFVDPDEFTVGDYKRVCRARYGPTAILPFNAQVASGSPDESAIAVSYVEAMSRAEDAGKRLLHEWEYEWLISGLGTSQFPWGDALPDERIAPARGGELSVAPFDCLRATSVAVRGLCSGKAEWVESPFIFSPRLWSDNGAPRNDESVNRVVRGALQSVLGPVGNLNWKEFGPGKRFRAHEEYRHPAIGFRCVRSVRPRLAPGDFPSGKSINNFDKDGATTPSNRV